MFFSKAITLESKLPLLQPKHMWEIKSYEYILHLHIYTYTEIISTLETSFNITPPSHTPGPSFSFKTGPSITFR
jgi:hypothetical protein